MKATKKRYRAPWMHVTGGFDLNQGGHEELTEETIVLKSKSKQLIWWKETGKRAFKADGQYMQRPYEIIKQERKKQKVSVAGTDWLRKESCNMKLKM